MWKVAHLVNTRNRREMQEITFEYDTSGTWQPVNLRPIGVLWRHILIPVLVLGIEITIKSVLLNSKVEWNLAISALGLLIAKKAIASLDYLDLNWAN